MKMIDDPETKVRAIPFQVMSDGGIEIKNKCAVGRNMPGGGGQKKCPPTGDVPQLN